MNPPASIRVRPWSGEWLLPALLLAFLWGSLIRILAPQWSVYEQYNYGWFVPLLCAYLLWMRRGDLPAAAKPPHRGAALAVMIGCALVFLPTRLLHEANPIWRLTSLALALEVILFTLAGVYLAAGGRWLRHFAFPVAFFLVAVPWPSGLEHEMIQTLTRANVGATIEGLNLLGIPALQHGNVIEIGTGAVGVDEACSGIRSFQTTLMISLFFGELYRLSGRRRVSLCLSGFALAFLFNVGRTGLLTWVAARRGVGAISRWHDPAGVTILVLCFITLWLLSLALRGKSRGQVPAREADRPGAIVESESNSGAAKSAACCTPVVPRSAFIWAFAAWFVSSEIVVESWYRRRESRFSADSQWSVPVPADTNRYPAVPQTDFVLRWLACDAHRSFAWRSDDGHRWQLFYFEWQPSKKLHRRVEIALSKTHRPDHCLPASGRELLRQFDAQTVRVAGIDLPFRIYLFSDQGTPLVVFHCLWEDGTPLSAIANLRTDTANRVAAAPAGARGLGQRSLEVAVWGIADIEDAKRALGEELGKLIRVERRE